MFEVILREIHYPEGIFGTLVGLGPNFPFENQTRVPKMFPRYTLPNLSPLKLEFQVEYQT